MEAQGHPLCFHQQVIALQEAIEALGLSTYALVGQDSGGFIARLLADQNPKVTNLILFNTEIPGLIPPWVPLFQLLAPWPFASQIFKLAVSTRLIARSPMGFGGCFYDKDLIHGEFFELTARPLMESPEKLSEVHRRITARVDCIWGEADPFFPVAKARTMFEQFAHRGEFVTFEKAKLLPYAEYPRESAEHIKRFIQPLRPS